MNIHKDEYLTLSWTFHIWIIDEDEIVKTTHKIISACPFFLLFYRSRFMLAFKSTVCYEFLICLSTRGYSTRKNNKMTSMVFMEMTRISFFGNKVEFLLMSLICIFLRKAPSMNFRNLIFLSIFA